MAVLSNISQNHQTFSVLQTDGRPVAHFDLIFIWATKFNNTVDQIGDHVIINVCDLLLEVKNHPGLML